jgi:hypothetical protein
MPTSRRWLPRKLYPWSYRNLDDRHEVELASADGEHVHCYRDFTWHCDGGPTEWIGPVPTISNSAMGVTGDGLAANPFKPW